MSKDFSALRLNLRKLPGATGKLGLLEPLLSESQRHTHLAFLLGTGKLPEFLGREIFVLIGLVLFEI